jgi:nucleoside-diphosphate-sugar epimerase
MKFLRLKVAPKEKMLITGATGFIGGWLVESLCMNGSADVRAGVKSWARGARIGRFPVEIVMCDVLDKKQIAAAMRGATCVIHCAKGSSEIIIQGTKNMLDVAKRLRVNRFVYLSTAEVYGNTNGVIDETSPLQYTGSAYGDSKIEAEKLCWEYYRKGLPVTVIRPSIVYGPFSENWTVRLAQSLQSGNWGIFKGIGDGVCNLIYISDLVSGILLASSNKAAAGEAFNMVGPELITWNQYFQRLNAAMELPKLHVIKPNRLRLRSRVMQPVRTSAKFVLAHFPGPLKKVSQKSRLAKEVMQSFEKTMRTSPQLGELSLYNRNAIYPAKKAQDLLGFSPRFDVETGLNLTVSWLNHLGMIDGGFLEK